MFVPQPSVGKFLLKVRWHAQIIQLAPDESCGTVAGPPLYMAETAVSTDSNPITSDSKCLLRKQNSSPNTVHTSCHGSNPPPPDPPVNDGESVIQDHHNNSELFHEDDAESSSSDSEGEGSSESSDESSEGEGEVSDEQELRNAGVEIDLNTLGPLDMGVAPLELLSEVCRCV